MMQRWTFCLSAMIAAGLTASPSTAREYCAGLQATEAFALQNICVSSALDAQKNNVYDINSLTDDSDATAWCENANGDGLGETITFTLSNAQPVRRLHFRNGYAKSADIYEKNNRVRLLFMTLTSGGIKKTERKWLIELDDSPREQVFTLPWEVKDPQKLTLTIQAVFPGSKYQDTCMNALSLGFGN